LEISFKRFTSVIEALSQSTSPMLQLTLVW
jgi:hypothetical protein